eukprot:gene3739-6269_t
MKEKQEKDGRYKRGRQDSNLRGQGPFDFESNSLTTRTRPLTPPLRYILRILKAT